MRIRGSFCLFRLRSNLAACLVLAGCLAVVAPALAGGGPSVENCKDKGLIDVECIVCSTGEYKGKVSVQAEYDPDYDDCMNRYREARSKCVAAYSLESSNAGCKWKYSMGGKEYSGIFPGRCKE